MDCNAKPDSLHEMLAKLGKLGISLKVDGTSISCQVPQGALDATIVDGLRSLGVTVVESNLHARASDCIVPLAPAVNAQVNIVCPHTAHGGVFDYRHLASIVPPRYSVYGIHGLSFLLGGTPFESIEEMAEYYVEHLLIAGLLSKPIAFYGACTGGLIALEMARRLSHMPECSLLLVAFGDTPNFNSYFEPPERELFIDFVEVFLPEDFLDIVPISHRFWTLTLEERFYRLAERMRSYPPSELMLPADPRGIRAKFESYSKYSSAYQAYQVRQYTGRSLYIKASSVNDVNHVTQLLTGQLRIEDLGTDHFAVLRPPGINTVARILSEEIDAALIDSRRH